MLENQEQPKPQDGSENNDNETPFFTEADVIYSYTRAEALADGVLFDALQEPFGTVSRQHFRCPIAMTAGVHALIERAVQNKQWGNDYAGVWHDILTLGKVFGKPFAPDSSGFFSVIIRGVGRQQYHRLRIVGGPGDDGEPVITVMLPEED